MSKRINKRAFISDHPRHVLLVPYRGLQYLLKYEPVLGHSERVEGWACDYYRIPHTNYYISTGYDPAGREAPLYKSGIANKYEARARDYDNAAKWTDVPRNKRKLAHRLLMIGMLREALGKRQRIG